MYVSFCAAFLTAFKLKGVLQIWYVRMLLNFKSTVFTRVLLKSALANCFVCHKQHFCPLGKRESNSLVVMVVMT